MSKRLLTALALPLAFVIAACSTPAASTTSGAAVSSTTALCQAVLQLDGNADDFVTLRAAETSEDYYAAIDRMSARTLSAVTSLRAVDGPAASLAKDLAGMEQGLLPILEQFRDTEDQDDWTAARTAYRQWYEQTAAAFVEIAPRVSELGLECQP